MGWDASKTIFVNSVTRVVVTGSEVVQFHKRMTGRSVTTINGTCYIDGFELVNGKWKRTFWAIWHLFL
jgi:hypothetical protein